MVAYKDVYSGDGRQIKWYCTGNRGERPFVQFNDYQAKREATKLRNQGYEATVVTVDAAHCTCFLDLKNIQL